MQKRSILTVLILGCGSLALLASGATAEWLVTSDGERVEIDGSWEVRGKLVVFKLPNGTLGSLPLSGVDLDASETANAEAARAQEAAPEPAPKPKAVMVITDADVGHVRPGRASADDDEESAAAQEAESPALRIAGWRENVDLASNAVRISGNVQNPTENPATSVQVTVMLYGEDGGLLESQPARLERGFVNPGATVPFEAVFTDTLSYERVEFDIRSRGFLAKPPPDETEATDDEVEEGSA